MNKIELIDEISRRTGFTKRDCKLFVNVFCDTITDVLTSGDIVKIVNFGIFKVKEVKAKKGKYFANDTICQIPARRIPVFAPGTGLKEIVGGAEYGDHDS